MTQFISRAYNTFELDKVTKSIVYKRSKESRLRDEAYYYSHLPKELSVYFPRIFHFKTEDNVHELALEYYSYDNLGNLMINESFEEKIWEKIIDFLFNFINHTKTYEIDRSDFEDSRLMYINKTENEYKSLIENFEFFKIFENNDEIYLNSMKLKTFKTIWPKIKDYIEKNCLVQKLNYVHGDMCFSNILYGRNPINNDMVLKFIDPRGSFGKVNAYGDYYYDLAKLIHSCNGGYEYFITDNFKVNNQSTSFTLDYNNDNKSRIKKIFDKFIDQYNLDKKKIKILEGCIFVGMCARHYDSLDRQKAMLLTGLNILNEVYDEL
jgi:hypothetical protein